jgi:hypothetical protein
MNVERNKLQAWAFGVRREHEGIVVMSLPRRARWRLYAAVALTTPNYLLRWARFSFLRATVWPGDRWWSITRDMIGVVVEVRHSRLRLQTASGQMLAAYGFDRRTWAGELPAGCLPTYRWVSFDDWSWGP